MKRRTASILKGCAVALVALAVIYVVTLWVSAKDLRRAYADLAQDGRPIKAEEVIPPRIPDVENAALLYDAAVQRLKATPAGETNLYECLSVLSSELLGGPLPDAQAAEWQRLLQSTAFQEAMRMIEEGTARPACRNDIEYAEGASALLPHLASSRVVTRILCAQARTWAAAGDTAGAWAAAAVALKYADALRDEPILVSQLVRVAQFTITAQTIHALCELIPSDAPTTVSVQTLLERFEDTGPWVTAMDGERVLFGEWAFMKVQNAGMREALAAAKMFDIDMVHWGVALGLRFRPLGQADHAAYLRLMRQCTPLALGSQRRGAEGTFEAKLQSVPRYCLLTHMLVPAIDKAGERFVGMIAMARITRAGLTVLEYRQKQGSYPDALAACGVGDLMDPFTGRPLVYRAEGKGFVVYSAGPDQKDDGGVDVEGSKPRGPDIVWRFQGDANTLPQR